MFIYLNYPLFFTNDYLILLINPYNIFNRFI